jgi:acetolactate synthase-1/2/3 large subunit
MKASDLFVKCLENEGVEYIFGVPGEEIMDLLNSLASSSIKFITTRHEQGAAFMADMYGRLTGKAGICLGTLGPGSTNLFTGIADANLDRAPLVAITGQTSLSSVHRETHQYIDIVSCLRPLTKWSVCVTREETIPEIIRRAFKIAQTEKPGACHISLPEDVARLDTTSEPLPATEIYYPLPGKEAIQRAARLIQEAENPILLAGNGVIRGRATEALRKLVDKVRIPVANTFMGKGTVSSDDELSLQTIGLQWRDYVSCGFDRADLVIAVGYDFVEYSPFFWNPNRDKKIIHIDSTPAEIDDCYKVSVEIIGDIKASLDLLCSELRIEKNPNFTPILRDYIQKELEDHAQNEAFPLTPQKILCDIRHLLHPEDILVCDVGAHKMWVARLYPTYEPNTAVISNGFSSMGFALPAGITAKLLYPKKNVVVVCGDGGFLMNCQELETACRLKLPLVIVIFRDDEYGLIAWKQMNLFQKKFGVSYSNPDFVAFAKAFGAEGYRITKAPDLKKILTQSLAADVPVVIEVPVDYSENLKLTQKLGNLVCPI